MCKKFVLFKANGEFVKVYPKEVYYIKNQGRKIQVHFSDHSLDFYNSVSKIKTWFDSSFYLCHSSLLVNFDKIKTFEKQGIQFINGKKVCIGIHNLRKTKKAYKQYLEENLLNNRINLNNR